MTIAEIINHDLPILKPSDTVGNALNWMEENRIGQLVVVDAGKYAGIVSEEILMGYNEDMELTDVMLQFSEISLFDYQHIYQGRPRLLYKEHPPNYHPSDYHLKIDL
jgi:signal-transduction protein with cAMP-binding, CBS, and nucleotidyltransferase domain